MEPPMSNGSMRHREPKSEIDDTGHFLQGASCTIAAKGPRQDTPRLRQVAQINMRRRVMTIVPGVPFLNIRRSRYRYTAVVQSMKLRADVPFTTRLQLYFDPPADAIDAGTRCMR
jgi:hypothetical protein